MRILYSIIDGEVTGGNIICLEFIKEAIRRNWKVVVNSPTQGKFTRMLREAGVKVYYIDTRRSFRFDSALKLAQVIKREKVNLIHSHAPLAGTVLSCFAGALTGTPVITHAHIRMALSPNLAIRKYQILLNWITGRLFSNSTIAVSETVKKEFIAQGTPGSKAVVIYNGIDLNNSKSKKSIDKVSKEFGLTKNQKIIGEVGRLCRTKGQHILLKTSPKVLKQFPDTVFIFVGKDLEEKGAYKEELKDLAKGLGVENRVIFAGYRSDVVDLMNVFDVFVLPSSAEGLPVVILEAMAAKKPVITTDVGGNTEVVIDGETGTIVPPEDPGALARAIIHHLENLDISRKMGERGYERVKKYFTRKKMVKKTFQVYEQVLKKRAAYV